MELHFTPRTPSDRYQAGQCLEDYTYEYNAEFGSFIFEESEDTIDNLEEQLDRIFTANDVNGYFEAQ